MFALVGILGAVAVPVHAQEPAPTTLDLASFKMPRPVRQDKAPAKPPSFTLELTLGAGDFEHDTSGTPLDGETDAGLLRGRFEGFGESGFGGGVEIEAIKSDDDLFTNAGFGESEASSLEIFGYGAYRVHSGNFLMPIRFGVFGREYQIEQQTPSGEVEVTSLGIKLAAEPDIAFVATENVRFGVFANVALGIGISEVETNLSSTKWDTSTTTFGFDAGLRLRLSIATLSLAYIHREEAIDESDVEGGTRIPAFDTDFDGVALTLGFNF